MKRKYLINNKKLMDEFDYERNNDIDIQKLTYGSHKKIWWICPNCNEHYEAIIYNRTSGHGCPYCASHILLTGKNDIATVHLDLLSEWDYEKNGNPQCYSANTHKKVWWICSECGHNWKATVKNRTLNRTKCPECTKNFHTSFPEQAIFYYIKEIYPDAQSGDVSLGVELDIYIPSKKIAIEYDGDAWHNTERAYKRDIQKNNICRDNNIHLYRIREPKLKNMENSNMLTIIKMKEKNKQAQENAIKELFNDIAVSTTIDLRNDNIKIMELYKLSRKEKNLENTHPEIAKEWNYDKNGKILPSMVFKGTIEKFWWKCNNGHEWFATVGSRTKGHGCPYCSGRFAIKGKTDLETLHPDITKEWNYEKNISITPDTITSQSNKNVWWKCSNGHEWKSPVYARTNGNKCPYCGNKKVLTGFNDLETLHPELIKEWNYNKNTKNPKELLSGTHYEANWICSKCGYEWQAMVYSRAQGHGCPRCGKKKRSRI